MKNPCISISQINYICFAFKFSSFLINNLKLFIAGSRNRKQLISTAKSTVQNNLETVGVIIDKTNLEAFKDLHGLAELLGVKESNISLICATEEALPENEFTCLKASVEDLTIKGNFRNPEINFFRNKNFDLLLCYLNDHNNFNAYFVEATNAKFKIGSNKEYSKLYDLVVLDGGDVDVYIAEAVKYLKILKRIS